MFINKHESLLDFCRAVGSGVTFKLLAISFAASVVAMPLQAGEIIDHTDIYGVTSSSNISDAEQALKVFDDTTETKWLTNHETTGWVTIDLDGNAYVVDSYTLTSANDATGRTPKDWELQGSNDGEEWKDLSIVTGETDWSTFEKRSYTCDPNEIAFSMYRFNITSNNDGGDLSGFSELEILSNGVDVTTSPLKVSVGSQNNDKEGVTMLTDNTANTKWLSSSKPSYIQFQFPDAYKCALNGYTMYSCNDYPTRDPKSWTFYGSNDGTSWVALDSRSGETWSGRYVGNTYYFDNSAEYAYYKIDITENNGASIIGVSEVELLQVIDDPEIATISPVNYSTITGDSVTLSWDVVRETENVTYNFYFAEDPADFGTAASYSLTGITETEVTVPESFINDDTAYYWQVDIVDDPYGTGTEVFEGTPSKIRVLRDAQLVLEWDMDNMSAGTEYSYEMPINNVTVTASSYETANTLPEYTYGGLTVDPTIADPNGLQHPNYLGTMWIADPSQEGDVWIQYDFDKDYAVGKMHIWNHNIGGDYTEELNRGMKNVVISYALSGTDAADPNNWTELGQYFIPKGTGAENAPPSLEIDLAGLETSAVRITAAAEDFNWGGAGAFNALSEVRFGLYGESLVSYKMTDASSHGNNAITYNNAAPSSEAISGTGLNLNYYGTMFMERDSKGENETIPLGKDENCYDAWSMNFYTILPEKAANLTFFVGFGDYDFGTGRYIAQFADGIHFWGGANIDGVTNVDFDLNRWQMITVTYDSETMRIYKNGASIYEGAVDFQLASPNVYIGGSTPWGDAHLNGIFDNFTMYKGKLSDAEIATLKAAMPVQYSALNPFPATGSANVDIEPVLEWEAPLDAYDPSYDVYIGTDGETFEAVATGLTDTSYDLLGTALEYGTTYYWYVDTLNGDVSDVWTFTTLPLSAKASLALGWDFENPIATAHTYEAAIENVIATASTSEQATRSPDRAVNGVGIFVTPGVADVTALKHGNNTNYTWISQPGASGEQWIKFEFDDTYSLGTMLVWNHNVSESYIEELNRGMQDVIVYYTSDDAAGAGQDPNDWTKLNNFTIPQGTGESAMPPSIGINFNGKAAKYVMIIGDGADSNYGNENNMHALAEVRFGIYGTTAEDTYAIADTSGNGNIGVIYDNPEFVNGIGSGNAVKLTNYNECI